MGLRVLFATQHVHFPQGGGGGERSTHELCLGLASIGAAPGVMCSLTPDRSWLSLSNRVRRVIFRRNRFPHDAICGYPVFRGWIEDGSAEIVQRFRPDVVVVPSTHPGPLVSAFTRLGVPTIAYIHEVEEIDHLRPLGAGGVPFLANSTFTATRLAERIGVSAEIVPPLIDPKYYRTRTNPERVLFVNTVPRKGVEIAFALAERRPDIPFDFVTSWIHTPNQLHALKERAAKTGNVTLHPPTRNMRALYARARVLLAPSQWEEAWGRVATEAHINGIPVLGSRRGGLTQAIGPGGITVPAPAPVETWLEGLARLWDDAKTYAAYSDAARNYSKRPEIQPPAVLGRLHDILVDLVNREETLRPTELRA